MGEHPNPRHNPPYLGACPCHRAAGSKVCTDMIENIVILTGAGISAESGLQTFRAADGLWEGHRVEDVATPEAYRRNPALVHQFYDARRARLGRARASAGSDRNTAGGRPSMRIVKRVP